MTTRYRRKVEQVGLPVSPLSAKPLAPFTLLQIVGKNQVAMMQQCLLSIHRAWDVIPEVCLVSDGSIDLNTLREATKWWPVKCETVVWRDLMPSLCGITALATFAETNTLGKKLVAVLASAFKEPTLFCDSDILWFGGPPQLPSVLPSSASLKMAQDIFPMYDPHLLQSEAMGLLESPPWLNSGICYAVGDLVTHCNLESVIMSASSKPAYFSEQTTLAIASRRLKGETWPLDKMVLKTDDAYRMPHASYPGKTWMARHYPGIVRHWFWRDAWELARNLKLSEANR